MSVRTAHDGLRNMRAEDALLNFGSMEMIDDLDELCW